MQHDRASFTLMAAAMLAMSTMVGQTAAAQDAMTIEEYDPKSTLVVPEHHVPRAKFPFIDVHGHMWRVPDGGGLAEWVAAMDSLNLQVYVNLSGGNGEQLAAKRQALESQYPGRFVLFANIDFDGIGNPGWTEQAVRTFRADVTERGAVGLKIFKSLGMDLKDASGKRVPVDDPRLDPIWAAAGQLGVPVLIHTGEPIAFFDPVDKHNERWLELTQFPRRRRPADEYPSWEALMTEQHHMFAKHPNTTFISAHLGWMGNDLGRLANLLDSLPNVYTEMGAVLYELGRQPRFARRFLIEYQDRVMMGKDSWSPDEFPYYFRVLETADDYVPYYRKRHAFWRLYGLDLPDEVLRKIYYANALRVIPGIDRSGFPR